MRRLKVYKGAGIALFKEKDGEFQILLGKRSVSPGYGKWSIPGGAKEKTDKRDGKMFFMDSYMHCAYREFKEETGLSFGSVGHFYLGRKRIWLPLFRWITLLYIGDDYNYEFSPNEFSQLKWVNLNELSKYDCAFFLNGEVKKFYRLVKRKRNQIGLESYANTN